MKRLIEYIRNNRRLMSFVDENRDMLIKVAAVTAVVVVAFFVFASKGGKEEPVKAEENVAAAAEEEPAADSIFVDVGGEVKTPMVAELKDGSRVEDAINAAGGLTENADITEINRAAFVEDGEKIFIPSRIPADEGGGSGDGGAYSYSDGKVNINTADSQELQELEGVGPVTAEKIIDYREENGRFSSVEDLKNVSGIGEKTFEKLKDSIKT